MNKKQWIILVCGILLLIVTTCYYSIFVVPEKETLKLYRSSARELIRMKLENQLNEDGNLELQDLHKEIAHLEEKIKVPLFASYSSYILAIGLTILGIFIFRK